MLLIKKKLLKTNKKKTIEDQDKKQIKAILRSRETSGWI